MEQLDFDFGPEDLRNVYGKFKISLDHYKKTHYKNDSDLDLRSSGYFKKYHINDRIYACIEVEYNSVGGLYTKEQIEYIAEKLKAIGIRLQV